MVRDLVDSVSKEITEQKQNSELTESPKKSFKIIEELETSGQNKDENYSQIFGSADADELLNQLLADRKNKFFVPHELISLGSSKPEIRVENVNSEPAKESSEMWGSLSNVAYFPSTDPKSPDYVPPGYTIDSDLIIQLVNPQISLESHEKGDESLSHTVVVAAESMQIQSIHILDDSIRMNEEAPSLPKNEEANGRRSSKSGRNGIAGIAEFYRKQILEDEVLRSEQIVKVRTILGIQNAQFFVARKADIEGAAEEDLDNIIMHKCWKPAAIVHQDSQTENMTSIPGSTPLVYIPWPIWVPIECLIDHSSHTGHLQRVVEQTSASFHRDKGNPLYFKRVAASAPSSRHTVSSKFESMQGDLLHINFPNFTVAVNTSQYTIIFNIINTLLVYRDPARGERLSNLREVTLGLEQVSDLNKVLETVVSLQNTIRSCEILLKQGREVNIVSLSKQKGEGKGHEAARSIALSEWPATTAPSIGISLMKQAEIRRTLSKCQDELYIYMSALKGMRAKNSAISEIRTTQGVGAGQTSNSNSSSSQVAWRLTAETSQLTWIMLMDDGEKLCRSTIDHLCFLWVHNEDQSTYNTIEVDKLCMENLSSIPNSFRDIISPYNAETYYEPKTSSALSALTAQTNSTKKAIDFRLHKMLRVFWRELSPVAGIRVVEHFEINIAPIFFQMNYEIGRQLILFLFPERRAKNNPPESTVYSEGQAHGSKVTALNIPSITKTTLSASASSLSLPTSFDETIDVPIANATKISSKKMGISTIQTKAKGKNKNSAHNYDLRQMQKRASDYRAFIYVKVPGVQHCLSYRGSKDKNFEDFDKFTFTMPTLEFRNKTWSWYDFWDQVKKDAIRAGVANSGAFIKDKLFKRKIAAPIPKTITSVDEDSQSLSSSSDKEANDYDMDAKPSGEVRTSIAIRLENVMNRSHERPFEKSTQEYHENRGLLGFVRNSMSKRRPESTTFSDDASVFSINSDVSSARDSNLIDFTIPIEIDPAVIVVKEENLSTRVDL
ncbi:hypothetical protein HK096_003065, partial [Nowakowskiella sp. JEL0078]